MTEFSNALQTADLRAAGKQNVKFIATAPDGSKDISRSSRSKSYSHAIMVFDPRPAIGWRVFAWVGRPDLVAAQLNSAVKRYGQSIRIEAVAVHIDA